MKLDELIASIRERWVVLPLVILSLFLMTFHVESRTVNPIRVRSIEGEERAVITATLDRLSRRGVAAKTLVSRIAKKLDSADLKIAAHHVAHLSDMVMVGDGVLIFSEGFFSSDSMTQEASLLGLVEKKDSHLSFLTPKDDEQVSIE